MLKAIININVLVLSFFSISCQMYAEKQNIPANSIIRKADFFPICVWMQNPALAGKYKKMGINCYVGLWKGPDKQQISDLKKYGMKVICPLNSYAEKFLLKEALVIAWMHDDEPDNAHKVSGYWENSQEKIWKAWPEYKGRKFKDYGPPVAPSTIIKDYQAMKQIDPSRPIFLNVGQGVAWDNWTGRGVRTHKNSDYKAYAKGGDIVAFDIYPVSHTSPEVKGNIKFITKGINNLRKLTNYRKPIWNCIETNHISNPQAEVTPAHVKAEVWLSIISGSKGIIYFLHQFKPAFSAAAIMKNPKMIKAIGAINKELAGLAGVINSPDTSGTVIMSPENTDMKFSTRKHNGYIYIFAVNTSGKKLKCKFSMHQAGLKEAELSGTGKRLAIRKGKLSSSFEPLEVKIFKIK